MSAPANESIRPADADEEESWRAKNQDQKLEYLYRTSRETMHDVLVAVAGLTRAVRDNTAKLENLDTTVRGLQGIVGNQAVTIASQVKSLMESDRALRAGADQVDGEVGQIAAELASIRKWIERESEERKKMDSIHEEEITGVGHKAVHAIERVQKAEGAVEQLKSVVTVGNVAKGVGIGAIVEIVSQLIKLFQ